MCLNLAKKQPQPILAFDLNNHAVHEVASAGAKAAADLQQLASESNIIITMLPGDSAIDAVMPTILEAVQKNSVLIDCSTVSPSTTRKWNQAATSRGHAMMDAPVSGGVQGAREATLTFMVGCREDSPVFAVVQPLFKAMGKRTISCGGPGTGAATKLCNNLALAMQMIGICEAMNLGEELGVDPETLADVMNVSTAKCWSSEVNNPHPKVGSGTPATNDYDGGFATKLMLKDLGLAVAAGKEAGVYMPLGIASRNLYQEVMDQGMGDKDFGVMLQYLRAKQRN
jgi:3-hydroxyisobutyrate dehydrogenase